MENASNASNTSEVENEKISSTNFGESASLKIENQSEPNIDSEESSFTIYEEDSEEQIRFPDPKVDTVIKPLVNPFVKKVSDEMAMKLFTHYQPKPKPPGFVPPKEPQPVRLKVSDIDRNGIVRIKFNQPLEIPSFIKKENNSSSVGPNGRKLQVDLQEIDVDRDIMEMIFLLNSDQNQEDIGYFLELIEWTEAAMKVHINFTNPLLVSNGEVPDVIFAKIKNTHMFQAKNSNERLFANQAYLRYQLPTELPHGLKSE